MDWIKRTLPLPYNFVNSLTSGSLRRSSVTGINDTEYDENSLIEEPAVTNYGSNSHSSSCNASYSPPLHFHPVHGENISFEKDRTIARRKESFCKGLTFSDRPIKIEEKVFVKLIEFSDNWSGVIRFGFTSHNPATLKGQLPRYACPDLTSMDGYWAKAVNENHYAVKDIVLYFYVNKGGNVYYGVDRKPKELFFSGVDTSRPLWMMIDVYGNSTAIELVNVQLNNSLTADQEAGFGLDTNTSRRNSNLIPEVEADLKKLSLQNPKKQGYVDRFSGSSMNNTNVMHAVSRPILNAGGALNPHDINSVRNIVRGPETKMTSNLNLKPLVFHEKRGLNIQLSKDRCIAMRTDTEFSKGYVFSPTPIGPNEFVVVQILETDERYLGSITFGVTTKNPNNIDPVTLPDDSDELLRDEHTFIVYKNVANHSSAGDTLIFSLDEEGEIKIKKNEEPQRTLFHVEKNQRYWWFFDLYGSTTKIRAYRGVAERPRSGVHDLRANRFGNTSTYQSEPGLDCIPLRNEIVPPQSGSQTVLLVLNYCVTDNRSTFEPISIHIPRVSAPMIAASTPTLSSTTSEDYLTISGNYLNEPKSQRDSYEASFDNGRNREQQRQDVMKTKSPSATDCIICFENQVDCVLYQCGHMCLCYTCACELWSGQGGGLCPCCRASIRDVVRTYRS